MTPEKLRSVLKKWLADRIRIDVFGLNSPKSILNHEQPPSSGLDLQAGNFRIANRDGTGMSASLLIETTLPFQVLYRFGSAYKYTEIPRGKAESILCSLMGSLNDSPECINPEILSINPSGEVTVYEEAKSDWVLMIALTLEVQFQCELNDLFFIDYGVFKP